MASESRRRRRSSESSDSSEEDTSRGNTPLSTAAYDGKRAKRNYTRRSDDTGIDAAAGSDETIDASDAVEGDHLLDDAVSLPPSRKLSHQPGAIVRVKLTNFVTYSSAEFFPGPNLNMVIGPNGTGKSTLVCAICLGLGWGTQYLGRAKDVSEFVKHGSREATIEIELQRATKGKHASKTNPVISRNIRREGNKSTFTLNGSQSSAKAVMALAQSYNIQIDNLCQFLPQDKVVEFAQMTPIQILESTQKAAAPPAMLEYHSALIELRRAQKEHGNDNKGTREQLSNLENRQEMQRTEVERLRERVIVQRQLKWLEQCRPIPKFADARKRAKESRQSQRQLEAEVKALKAETRPTLHKVNAKQDYMKAVQDRKQNIEKNVKRATNECNRLEADIKQRSEEMQEYHNLQEAEKKSEGPARQEIAREKTRIQGFQKQKENRPEEFNHRGINQDINDKTSQTRALEAKMDELKDVGNTSRQRGEKLNVERRSLQTQLEKLNTQTGQRESRLEEASRDAHRAWTWIQENQDKFAKRVYGPPIVECSLTEPSRAKQIEALFQQNDFKIITAQCREDFKVLQTELITKQRLSDISLRVCTDDSLESFRPPLRAEQMDEHGLSGWAMDYLQGPATVVAMLCQERFLHQTAIATHDLTDQQFKRLEATNIKCCLSNTAIYRFIRRSEYGAAGVISDRRELTREPKFWSGETTDVSRQREIQTRINELGSDLREIRDGLGTLKQDFRDAETELGSLQTEIDNLKEEKARHQSAMVTYNSLDTKISQAEAKIAKNEETLATMKERLVEHQQTRDQAMFAKAELTLKYVDAVHELHTKQQELLEIEVMLIEAVNDFEVLSARNQHIVDLIKQKEQEHKTAAEEAKRELATATRLIDAVRKLRDEGDALESQEGDSGLKEMIETLAERQGFREEDLDELIDVEKAKLDLTDGGDSNMITEYEERAKKITKLRNKVSEFAAKQKDLIDGINEVRQRWEPALDQLVEQISEAFGESFARIGCAGQVAVYKPSSIDPLDCTEQSGGVDNGLDFENWAIHISVKFRENEGLSLLDSHRQSGGERAVSTIFYLMALQSLSRAPFRVVDEINQGMDPRNERMVHGRMVDIAAADERDGHAHAGSQYFLITPKLLSGLTYKAGMTVLCIVSGENMPSAVDVRLQDDVGHWSTIPGARIDFAKFAHTARQLGLHRRSGPGQQQQQSSQGPGYHLGMAPESPLTRVGA